MEFKVVVVIVLKKYIQIFISDKCISFHINSFQGDDVLDIFNNASRDEDNKLDQIKKELGFYYDDF